jgi:Tfp pilus assembly pilus retraction ATPase PilT
LKGVLSQSLLKRCDNKGRVAALEIMVGTPAMANLIREGKTHQLQNVIQTGRRLGMRTSRRPHRGAPAAEKSSPRRRHFGPLHSRKNAS